MEVVERSPPEAERGSGAASALIPIWPFCVGLAGAIVTVLERRRMGLSLAGGFAVELDQRSTALREKNHWPPNQMTGAFVLVYC